MIGHLKRSLKERCPECGSILQVRSFEVLKMEKGVDFYTEEDYIACSNKNCDYQTFTNKNKKNKRLKVT